MEVASNWKEDRTSQGTKSNEEVVSIDAKIAT